MTIEESKNIQKRIFNYCTSHLELAKSGIIKGMDGDGNVVLAKNNVEKRVPIEILEKNLFDFDKFEEKKVEMPVNSLDTMVEEPVEELIENLDETSVPEKVPTNLAEFKECVASKNESSINKALETFAIDSTGKININKAIKVVTDNSSENVINCVRDNKKLPTNLSAYDITGKCTIEKENAENNNVDDLIDSSFNNIMVYVDAAKLKNINFTEDQISNAKTKYTTQVNDRLNVLGLNKPKDEDKIIDLEVKKREKEMSLQLKPDKNIAKAGFADIIILTVIVFVYAAIIINLIMKIK